MFCKKTKSTVTLTGQTPQRTITRRTVLTGLGLLCLAISPLLPGCKGFESETGDVRTEKTGMSLKGDIDTSIPEGTIPPIDAAAPSRTESATFALG